MSPAITPTALEVTDASFEQVIQSERPVLIDFWAAWCGPCRVIAPVIEALAQEHSDRFTIGKFDVDQHPAMTVKYGVRRIPTLIIFKHGKEVERLLGGQYTQEALRDKLALHDTDSQ